MKGESQKEKQMLRSLGMNKMKGSIHQSPRSSVSRYVPLVHARRGELSKQTEISKIRQHSLALERMRQEQEDNENVKGTNKKK